jgi:hypothetical protein
VYGASLPLEFRVLGNYIVEFLISLVFEHKWIFQVAFVIFTEAVRFFIKGSAIRKVSAATQNKAQK